MRILVPILLLAATLSAEPQPIRSVLVGHTTGNSVRLCVETAGPGTGAIVLVRPDGVEERKEFETNAEGLRRAHVEFEGLSPRTAYRLVGVSEVGGKSGELGRVRTLPSPGAAVPLRIGFGSCLDPRADKAPEFRANQQRTIVPNHTIWEHLGKEELDAFLWIGDRFYVSNFYEQFDGRDAASVRKEFLDLHDKLVAVPGVADLMRRAPNYAIWDDHDYGPNNAAKDFEFKQVAFDVLKTTFANPPMGEQDNPGCYFKLTMGAVDLFLLDNRWHRDCAGIVRELRNGVKVHSCTPLVQKRADGTWFSPKPLKWVHGARQMEWLRQGLLTSKATFKLVVDGGQMLSNNHRFEAWYQSSERDAFLAWLREKKVPGVVFVSGDRHHGEIGVLREGGPYPLYEITSSGLGVAVFPLDEDTEESPYDVLGGVGSTHNYGLIEFDPADGGSLNLRLIDKNGKEAARHTIRATELR